MSRQWHPGLQERFQHGQVVLARLPSGLFPCELQLSCEEFDANLLKKIISTVLPSVETFKVSTLAHIPSLRGLVERFTLGQVWASHMMIGWNPACAFETKKTATDIPQMKTHPLEGCHPSCLNCPCGHLDELAHATDFQNQEDECMVSIWLEGLACFRYSPTEPNAFHMRYFNTTEPLHHGELVVICLDRLKVVSLSVILMSSCQGQLTGLKDLNLHQLAVTLDIWEVDSQRSSCSAQPKLICKLCEINSWSCESRPTLICVLSHQETRVFI